MLKDGQHAATETLPFRVPHPVGSSKSSPPVKSPQVMNFHRSKVLQTCFGHRHSRAWPNCTSQAGTSESCCGRNSFLRRFVSRKKEKKDICAALKSLLNRLTSALQKLLLPRPCRAWSGSDIAAMSSNGLIWSTCNASLNIVWYDIVVYMNMI